MKALPGPTPPTPRPISRVRATPGSGLASGLLFPMISAGLALAASYMLGGDGLVIIVALAFVGLVGLVALFVVLVGRHSQRDIERGLRAAREREMIQWIESLSRRATIVTTTVHVVPEAYVPPPALGGFSLGEEHGTYRDVIQHEAPPTVVLGVVEPHEAG